MNKPAILGGKPAFTPALPFLRPFLPSYEVMENDLKSIFSSGILTKGKYLKEYESVLKRHLGVDHAVGVSSCTLGLVMVLRCLELKGNVIVPSFTFPSTIHAIMWNKLTPLFVDCHNETFNLDPSLVEKAINSETSAILAVHIFGNPADVEVLEDIARRYKLKLIFDTAHGFGSELNGKPLGIYGCAEVFSTSPTKLLITGEGGVVTTGDDELAEKIRIGIEYGNPGDYDCLFAGLNARLSEINSLTGIYSFSLLEENAKIRNRLVELYKKYLSSIPGITFQKINGKSSYKDFAILVGSEYGLSRDHLWRALESEGVITRRYFYPPNHLQKALKYLNSNYNLPVTEEIAERVLCLPIYSSMS
ncbi:MAG TPA: DegT/DnrJ/EryC1/StrS family aminotransferase, partial [Candidatus Eremiobacteraeota bacterium]|nr:DegT/DnrJ/EryC1/StrS family aminotransferase [Candidatus Eremiobacteraeota bacterium]